MYDITAVSVFLHINNLIIFDLKKYLIKKK